jgi:hypothetical protein
LALEFASVQGGDWNDSGRAVATWDGRQAFLFKFLFAWLRKLNSVWPTPADLRRGEKVEGAWHGFCNIRSDAG